MKKTEEILRTLKNFSQKYMSYIVTLAVIALVVITYFYGIKSGKAAQIKLNRNQTTESHGIVATTEKEEESQTGYGKIRFSELIETAPVNDIVSDLEGGVWVATENGVSHIINNGLTNYSYSEGNFPFLQAQSAAIIGKELKVASLFGLCEYDKNGRFVKDEIGDTLPSQTVWDIQYDGSNFWFGTQNGVYFITNNATTVLTTENTMNSLKDNWCKRIKNFFNYFVAIHDKGVSIWDTNFPASNPNAWKNIEYSKSILNRPINDVAYDGQFLWLATGNGVFKLLTPLQKLAYEKNYKFSVFTELQGLASNNARSIVYAKDSIWVGTSEGLTQIKNDQIKVISPISGKYHNNIRKLYAFDDILWIGTDVGIQYINMATVNKQ